MLFISRCKLYRFDRDTKENKERGLGDIKVNLINNELNKINLLIKDSQKCEHSKVPLCHASRESAQTLSQLPNCSRIETS